MQYLNKEHTLVLIDGAAIPKFHTLWNEHVVEGAEIAPYVAPDTTAQDAHDWVIAELNAADLHVSFHLDTDPRAVATQTEWRAYRVALRNYTSTNAEGTILINGERPVKPL